MNSGILCQLRRATLFQYKLYSMSRIGRSNSLVQAYSKSHAFAQLQGADNIISFKTERYSEQPMFIRGPGAGAEVTAAGVFNDLLLLARSNGARP